MDDVVREWRNNDKKFVNSDNDLDNISIGLGEGDYDSHAGDSVSPAKRRGDKLSLKGEGLPPITAAPTAPIHVGGEGGRSGGTTTFKITSVAEKMAPSEKSTNDGEENSPRSDAQRRGQEPSLKGGEGRPFSPASSQAPDSGFGDGGRSAISTH